MNYIGIQDIAANSFIELSKIDNIREIPLSVIENYGNAVVRHLNEGKKKPNSFLILSRDYTDQFEREYKDFFEIRNNNVFLMPGITTKELIEKFRMYMNLDVMIAFIDNDVVCKSLYKDYAKYLRSKSYKIKKQTKY